MHGPQTQSSPEREQRTLFLREDRSDLFHAPDFPAFYALFTQDQGHEEHTYHMLCQSLDCIIDPAGRAAQGIRTAGADTL